MLQFAAAFALAIASPGPGVLSVAGAGAAFGFRAGARLSGRAFPGNNAVGVLVVSGLAAAALAVPAIRTLFLVASTAYMLWLAARIALAGSKIAVTPATRRPGLIDGRCCNWSIRRPTRSIPCSSRASRSGRSRWRPR